MIHDHNQQKLCEIKDRFLLFLDDFAAAQSPSPKTQYTEQVKLYNVPPPV